MAKFLLLARGAGIRPGMSPEEIQRIIGKYRSWSEALGRSGKLRDGSKLCDGEGRVLRHKNGSLLVTDGPFTEANEVLGGYWLFEAEDYADAERTLADHPHLEFGTLELRRLDSI